MSNLFWLTEAQIARLEPFFPKSHGRGRLREGAESYAKVLANDILR